MKRPSKKSSQLVKLKEEEITNEVPKTTRKPFTPIDEAPQSFWKRLSDNLSYSKYIIILLFLPPILNLGALKREAMLFTDGQKVDMGWGQKMYINCKGTGLPTVILDAPTGTSSDIWLFVHKELATLTQVCIYDRSGIGSSDPISKEMYNYNNNNVKGRQLVAQPSTLNQMTDDLHNLLKEANPLPHPYVLVGSEVGSLIARMYSILHTQEVSDIVLVDPLVENLFLDDTEWKDYWYSKLLPSFESLHLSAIVGISRIAILFGLMQPSFFKEQVPEDVMNRQKSLLCNPQHINSALYEYLLMNNSFIQMGDAYLMKPFPKSVSVTILSREHPAEVPADLYLMWKKSQDFLAYVLHPNCQNKLIPKEEFLELYSASSPIITEVRKIIHRWRKNHGILPVLAQ